MGLTRANDRGRRTYGKGNAMAWVYQCPNDNARLLGETKEQLADKMVQHMLDMHDTEITYDQAMQEVMKDAKQAA